jgi:hypothetical protein
VFVGHRASRAGQATVSISEPDEVRWLHALALASDEMCPVDSRGLRRRSPDPAKCEQYHRIWQLLSDGLWTEAFVVAVALALRSNMRGRLGFCVLLGLLPLSRLVLGSGGGGLGLCLELPAMVLVGCLAIRAYFGGTPPPAGICASCGYDLAGNVSGVCPECGEEIQYRQQESEAD